MMGEGAVRATGVHGNVNDPAVVISLERRVGGSFNVDPVDFEWDEAHGRRHGKRSLGGRAVELALDEETARRGLADGDVLAVLPAPALAGAGRSDGAASAFAGQAGRMAPRPPARSRRT
ncbi:MAG: hypothetical protein E7001_04035 [Coriobacteriaceae bacterium]|nr:hypothetical protein [Coriobacteriaceae bacterium]